MNIFVIIFCYTTGGCQNGLKISVCFIFLLDYKNATRTKKKKKQHMLIREDEETQKTLEETKSLLIPSHRNNHDEHFSLSLAHILGVVEVLKMDLQIASGKKVSVF